MSSRLLVTLAYSDEAALNMAVKLSVEVEGPADLLLVDIRIAGRSREGGASLE